MATPSFVKTMENELEEGSTSKKHKFMLKYPDWLDLPEPIATNIILEHLELVDYIRFSAVCKKWLSIQKEHRISYSPYPPPSPLPFPWLLCRYCKHKRKDRSILFHLTDKQKSYNISSPSFGKVLTVGCGHGWLLLLSLHKLLYHQVMHIFNPITGVQIKLPMLENKGKSFNTHISSPPTNPDCTIFIVSYFGKIYFYRVNDEIGWKEIQLKRNGFRKSVLRDNKIYHKVVGTLTSVYMVDTLLPDPVEQTIEMDCSEIPLGIIGFDLVDFLGELVMITGKDYNYDTFDFKEFQVYRADFVTNKWVRMETLGDHVLFYSTGGILALPAVEVGCKKNVIYFAKGQYYCGYTWMAFDLSTKYWINGPPLSLPMSDSHANCSFFWFLPSLDSFDVTSLPE